MAQLNVYFSEQDKQQISTDAKTNGLKPGTFLKFCWKHYMKGIKNDLRELRVRSKEKTVKERKNPS
jgi:hypothetical protein